MLKRILFYITLLMIFVNVAHSADVVTVNRVSKKVIPSYTNLQLPLYPVFNFQIPEGYTDFELKASIANFEAGVNNVADEADDHVGEEVVFYYYSCYPYIGATGIAPHQKFDFNHTHVYFSASNIIKYTFSQSSTKSFSGSWDSRKYIYQTKSSTVISSNNTNYDIKSYLASNAKVGGVLMICAFTDNTFTDITSTNVKLIWTIRFFNRAGGEIDTNGNPVFRPITPTAWVGVDFINGLTL